MGNMIFEGITRKIDSAGRIIIPKSLRNKFRINEGSAMEYFTCSKDGKDYICVAVAADEAVEEKEDK